MMDYWMLFRRWRDLDCAGVTAVQHRLQHGCRHKSAHEAVNWGLEAGL